MDPSVHEYLDKIIHKSYNQIAIQISRDHDISITKINESIEKVIGISINNSMNECKVCKAKVLRNGVEGPCGVKLKHNVKGDFCGRHAHMNLETEKTRIEPNQCKGFTAKGDRCSFSEIKNKGYCRKHFWLHKSDNIFVFDSSQRLCLHSDIDDNEGELIRCNSIVCDKYYTCKTHREFEDTLRTEYDLKVDAIQFTRDYMNNKVSQKDASIIFGTM